MCAIFFSFKEKIMRRIILPFVLLMFSISSIAQQTTTVYFDFDKWQLTSTAQQTLDVLIKGKPFKTISIYGHTDQLGSEEYNRALSSKRAEAVKSYLLENGIDANVVAIVQAFGEERPAIEKLDATSRKANRRVAIEAVKDVDALATTDPQTQVPAPPVTTNPVPEKTVPERKPSTPPVTRQQTKEKLVEEIRDTGTKAGDNIVLKNINFYGGRHAFLPTAYPALQDLFETMQAVPTLEIEIQGHICCQPGGGDGVDLDTGEPFLSYNRAKAVFEFLARRGIDRNRMRYRGFGRRFPIIENEITEEEKTTNRRVEIKIIKK
jgi:outer membrane protein OmpA-like peptidoglycan-associated protein